MEFYITMPYSAETNVGFNSQWDGILQDKYLDKDDDGKVSIPNGMEFYGG